MVSIPKTELVQTDLDQAFRGVEAAQRFQDEIRAEAQRCGVSVQIVLAELGAMPNPVIAGVYFGSLGD